MLSPYMIMAHKKSGNVVTTRNYYRLLLLASYTSLCDVSAHSNETVPVNERAQGSDGTVLWKRSLIPDTLQLFCVSLLLNGTYDCVLGLCEHLHCVILGALMPSVATITRILCSLPVGGLYA